MKALICGGRDYNDRSFLFDFMNSFHAKEPITEVIHGAARGADTLGGAWAESKNIPVTKFPANWNLGKAAGFIRNQQMLDQNPDIVIAFPGGNGTKHTVETAKKMGIRVVQPGL